MSTLPLKHPHPVRIGTDIALSNDALIQNSTANADANLTTLDAATDNSGTATGGSTTTLVDSNKTWATNVKRGALLVVDVSGTEHTAFVTSHTANTLTFTPAAQSTVPAGARYRMAPKCFRARGAHVALVPSLTGGGSVDATIYLWDRRAQIFRPAGIRFTLTDRAVSFPVSPDNVIAIELNNIVTASVYNIRVIDMMAAAQPAADSAGRAVVTLGTAIAGEDQANDWLKVRRVRGAGFNPAKTTTSINAPDSVILPSTEVIELGNLAVTIKNTHGVNSFTACAVQVSPDGVEWISVDTTTFASLTAGAVATAGIANNGHRYIRVRATAANNAGSSDVWITGNYA